MASITTKLSTLIVWETSKEFRNCKEKEDITLYLPSCHYEAQCDNVFLHFSALTITHFLATSE